MRWREEEGVRWLEASLPGATAAFSTRIGGVSEGPFESLNLGVFTEDVRERVVENRRRLASALGFAPDHVAIARQVHGAEIAVHSAPQRPSPYAKPGSEVPEVDGHVTAEPSLPLLVFAADCLPIALSGPGGVAMLHCGWRGLDAGIVERGVEAVGATDAAIGPGIGPCCHQVALVEGAREQLRDAGVERVESADLCTSCEEELFFSHRRDAGVTGRQAGLLWREAEAT
jgi:purine-nucleoside/S-methyl-5'-thioadenosine phosphorylase / adenosine deaminase